MTVGGLVLAAVLTLAQSTSAPSYGRVAGQVVEQGRNSPIAGARITLMSAGRPTTMPPPLFETMADADGRFAFDAVPPGEYRIQAIRAGYAMPTFDTPPSSVSVAAGQTQSDVMITLLRGGAIAGRVTDATGEPQAEVRVMALQRVQNGPPMPVPTGPGAQTDDLGAYRVYGLAPGQYYLQVIAQPMMGPFSVVAARPTVSIPTYYPAARAIDGAQTITVTAGETVKDADIRVIETAAFQIAGIVIDETGAPVAGAAVSVMSDRNPASGMPFMFAPPSNATTNADGTFSVPNLSSGTYIVSAGMPMTGGPVRSGGIGATAVSGVSGFTNFATWSVGPNGISFPGRGNQERITITDANIEGVRITLSPTNR